MTQALNTLPLPTVDVPFVPGARSSVVYDLQQWLQQRGLYSGPLDGEVTPPTRIAAARAFTVLANSPALDARYLTRTDLRHLSVGQALATLQSAGREADAYFALNGAATGSPANGKPPLPDKMVSFTPAQMAETMKPGFPWGKVGLVAGGLVAGVIVGKAVLG